MLRRRHGIPDSDKRSFKLALSAANDTRRKRILEIQAEEERKRQFDLEESSKWRMLGKSTGWCPQPNSSDHFNDVDSSSTLPGGYDPQVSSNSSFYEPPKFEYIPSSPSNRLSTSSIARDLHSLRYPLTRNVDFPDVNEESNLEDEQSEISMNVDDYTTYPNLTRKRSMDEFSQRDESDLISFEDRHKRRRATSLSTDASNTPMSEGSYENESLRRSASPQNDIRGRKRSLDDSSDIVSVNTRSKKLPKNSDEWTDLTGTTYKYDDGVKKRLTVVKEWRSKYNMPKDSQHPDRNVKLRVFVERWITDDEYQDALNRYELAWQPDEDELISIDNKDAHDENMSQLSESYQPQVSRKSSGVYYTRRTPIKRQVSNRSLVTPSVSSVTSSPPNSSDGKQQANSRLRLNRKNNSELNLSKSTQRKDKEREADMLTSIRKMKAANQESEVKRDEAAKMEQMKKDETQRREEEGLKQKEEAKKQEKQKEDRKARASGQPGPVSFNFGDQMTCADKSISQTSKSTSNDDKKDTKTTLPSFNFGASSAENDKPASSLSQPPQAQAGGFSFNFGKINKNVARAASNRKAVICQPVMRSYSSQGGESGGGSGRGAIFAGGALLTGLGLYFFNNLNNYEGTRNQAVAKIEEKLPVDSGSRDYQKVYNAIVDVLENENYDDGTFAPVLLRLAWHASGTFSKHDKANPGGSNKATMRFKAEAEDGANAGLEVGRDLLNNRVKPQFPWISYGDLWTLAGVVGLQEMGGPKVAWRPGRIDGMDEREAITNRLPDGAKDEKHVQNIFDRLGFDDGETVCLIGAHAVGRTHRDRSGFEGPWTFSPITFSNQFYKLLMESEWKEKKWDGPKQYEDQETKSLMMLPTDYALRTSDKYRPYVEKYAEDEDVFFKDFSRAFAKLIELGVPLKQFEHSPPVFFKTSDEVEAEKDK
ncbi:hypothetical protein E3P77_02818 [Wallemia ichthyophaga]|nr:hypothetical protein E3P77_02818 [Wallemia ichthyophaga]